MDLSGASHWFSHCDSGAWQLSRQHSMWRRQVFLYPQQSILLSHGRKRARLFRNLSPPLHKPNILPFFSKKTKNFHDNNNTEQKKNTLSQDLANLITARRVGVTTEWRLWHCQGGGGERRASAAERPRNQRNSTELQFPEKAIRIAISSALSVIQPGMRSDFSLWKQEALLPFILKGEKEEIPINGGTLGMREID